jgi:hypothetical protein
MQRKPRPGDRPCRGAAARRDGVLDPSSSPAFAHPSTERRSRLPAKAAPGDEAFRARQIENGAHTLAVHQKTLGQVCPSATPSDTVVNAADEVPAAADRRVRDQSAAIPVVGEPATILTELKADAR